MRTLWTRAGVGAALAIITSGAVAQLAAPPTESELRAGGAMQVQGEALAALLNDKTIQHTNLQTGQNYSMFYRADGRRFIKLGATTRSTKWWIQDGMRCEDSISTRGSVCQKIFQLGDVHRICSVGEAACNWVVSFEPGDVDGLAK